MATDFLGLNAKQTRDRMFWCVAAGGVLAPNGEIYPCTGSMRTAIGGRDTIYEVDIWVPNHELEMMDCYHSEMPFNDEDEYMPKHSRCVKAVNGQEFPLDRGVMLALCGNTYDAAVNAVAKIGVYEYGNDEVLVRSGEDGPSMIMGKGVGPQPTRRDILERLMASADWDQEYAARNDMVPAGDAYNIVADACDWDLDKTGLLINMTQRPGGGYMTLVNLTKDSNELRAQAAQQKIARPDIDVSNVKDGNDKAMQMGE